MVITEWDTYPIWQFLEPALKIFHIQRFCVIKINDNLCTFLVSKFALWHLCTLTDLSSCCPRSLQKTTPTPPGCPWVPGGPVVTPKPSFSGLVLDHQVLKKLDLKKLENCCFWSNLAVFERFLASGCFQTWWSSTKPQKLGSGVTSGPQVPIVTPGALE